MVDAFCLGQILVPFPSASRIHPQDIPQVAFLQRGNQRVHVLGANRLFFGDLSEIHSRFLGPLLGPLGGCSTRVTEARFTRSDNSLIKLQGYVVTKTPTLSQLRACVFSRSEDVPTVLSAFSSAGVDLLSIWNYNPSIFFEIPHLQSNDHRLGHSQDYQWLQPHLALCRTTLKDHQLTALRFLRKNELDQDTIAQLWHHSDNNWIRDKVADWNVLDTSSEDRKPRGSILADDMGLGKTLTALMFILATSPSSLNAGSLLGDSQVMSAATLVICPLATLSNWENEIHLHFLPHAIPYCVFHGRNRGEITHEELMTSMVVLTTYEMIGASGNNSTSLPMIQNLNICWFRIVLDEAQ